jgi:hypothetical protein
MHLPDACPWMLAPTERVYRAVFACFAGSVAQLTLSPQAFFGGSATLAAAVLPREFATPPVVDRLEQWQAEEDARRATAFAALSEIFGNPNDSVVAQLVLDFVGGIQDISDLREDVDELQPQREWDAFEADPLHHTYNGFGPYARSDVDIFLAAPSASIAFEALTTLFGSLRGLDGDAPENVPCVLKTTNTVTFCRSWPERPVQVVIQRLATIEEHLLFADLGCTAIAFGGTGRFGPVINRRCLRALTTMSNEVPVAMLMHRLDAPARVAAYMARGFTPIFHDDTGLVDSPDMQRRVDAAFSALGRKLLDWEVLVDPDQGTQAEREDFAVRYLVRRGSVYTAFSVPRVVGLTAAMLRAFYSARGVVVIDSADQLPACPDKLGKVGLEHWLLWGMLSDR